MLSLMNTTSSVVQEYKHAIGETSIYIYNSIPDSYFSRAASHQGLNWSYQEGGGGEWGGGKGKGG
jgi:hypothetical protein